MNVITVITSPILRARLQMDRFGNSISPVIYNSTSSHKKVFERNTPKTNLMPALVRISDLALYLRCPRWIYFESMGHLAWPESKNLFNLILKDLVLSLSDFEGGNLETWLIEKLDRAEVELPIVYGAIDPEELRAASEEIKKIIPEMARKLEHKIGLISPSEAEVELRSDRLGLSGRLDRLVLGESTLPSMIRTGLPPETGVWQSDRLSLAGYALLLEDERGERIEKGLVEYPRAGEIREVNIRVVDRRRVLRIRDRIRQIRDGKLPDRPKSAPCEGCPFEEKCETRRSIASRFF